MKPELVIVSYLPPPEIMETLEREFTLHRLWEADDPKRFLADVGPRARGLVTTGAAGASADLMDALSGLEIIACYGVGVDGIDLDHARHRGVAVTNTPDVLTVDVAELAMALLLATARRVCAADQFVRRHEWLKGEFGLTRRISGRRLVIVGLGRIGKALAKRAASFDMDIRYFGSRPQADQPYPFHDDLVALARDCDFLAITAAGGPRTRGLIGRDVLDALGSDGILINVARGSLVDEPALVAALREGRLGGAGLDVFADEPRVPAALLGMDNVVLQPHQGSATREARLAMGGLVIDNLRAHFSGRQLPTRVP